jgi:hypothetical protein
MFLNCLLPPCADYIYRVVAKNAIGENASPWGYGRTREGGEYIYIYFFAQNNKKRLFRKV